MLNANVDPVGSGGDSSDAPKQAEDAFDIWRVELALRLGSRENQIEEVVVRFIEKLMQTCDILVTQGAFVPIEKSREHEVVLEQTSPRSPSQPPSVGTIVLMGSHYKSGIADRLARPWCITAAAGCLRPARLDRFGASRFQRRILHGSTEVAIRHCA